MRHERLTTPLLAALSLGAFNACARPPDPATVEAFTAGVWHTPIGEEDYLYEFTFEEGALGGRLHRVVDARQINEIPVDGVSFDGAGIEIGNRGFPPFRGHGDLEEGRIEGGVLAEPRFRDLTLTRVDASEWPMLQPRPAATPGQLDYGWARPGQTDDGWETGTPAELGIRQEALEETVRAIVAGEAGALHSLLVARNGALVLEEYFYGWDRDDLHHITSCTKSVSSLLVGIAIDQGYLNGVDVPLLELFPDYADDVGRGWDAIRLEHLLTMTMGLDWTDSEIGSWAPPGDQFSQILGRDVAAPPGSRFRYGSRDVNLVSGILVEATGVEADVFAQEHLFAPLGITTWDWEFRRWQNHPEMAASLKLRPRDMAKLGQLVLDEGAWQGKRVVSADWIRKSVYPHVPDTPHGVQYGYLWWRVTPSGSPLGAVPFANGIGSQFIAVVPEARLVIVTTGGNSLNDRQFDIVRVAEQYLFPGISVGQSPAE
jgi:CubicO group peptidase (beta-lactamase class C family)